METSDLSITATDRLRQEEHQAEQDARAHVLSLPPGGSVRPADLQRTANRPWNAACHVLEQLEKDGELVRVPDGGRAAWTRAEPPGKPPRGYAPPLSPKEHGALLRGLDWIFDYHRGAESQPLAAADLATLRAIRAKLKRPA